MTRAHAILFDLDGTLLDTAPDMIGALNLLRQEEGLEPLPFAAVRSSVSHGAVRLVTVGFPSAQGDEFERLRQRFLAIYSQNLAAGTRLFAGLEQVLAAFEVEGLPWGIVTNKPGWLTDPLLEQLNLARRACCVVSGDTVNERKPHPLPMLHAAAVTGVSPDHCVYVGDAERDIVAGRAAGMQTVVAGWGYLGEHDHPETWNADGIIERPEDVMDWLTLRRLDAMAAS
ncbi:MAG: phosphoglycolate phosphatase [Steroidobacteraceae bacterium]